MATDIPRIHKWWQHLPTMTTALLCPNPNLRKKKQKKAKKKKKKPNGLASMLAEEN